MSNKTKALMFDMVFFMIIAFFGEFMNHKALIHFYSGYYFSITLLVAFICIFRWGYPGVIVAVYIGLISVYFMKDATWQTYIIYGVSNLGIIFSVFFMKWKTSKNIRENTSLSIPYVLSGYGMIILIRSIVLRIFGQDFISSLFLVLSNEFLNVIAITMFVSLIIKRKFLMVDIKSLYDEL